MKSTQKGDYAKWYFIKSTWIQRPCLLVADKYLSTCLKLTIETPEQCVTSVESSH